MTTSEATSNLPAQFIPGAHATGMDFPMSGSFQDWERTLANVRTIEQAIPWIVGDLIDHAMKRGKEFEDHALQVVAILDYDPHTAKNWAGVCSRIPKSRRRSDTDFGHHEAVAYLKDIQAADLLLADAVNEGWTVKRLREEVKLIQGKPAREPKAKTDWRDMMLLEAMNLIKIGEWECECRGYDHLPYCQGVRADEWLKRYRGLVGSAG